VRILASAIILSVLTLNTTSCRTVRGAVTGTRAAGTDLSRRYVCLPTKPAANPRLCLAASGDPAPCLTGVVLQPTDNGTPRIYVMRGQLQGDSFTPLRPYLFEHGAGKADDESLSLSWGPGLEKRLTLRLTTQKDKSQTYSGTLTGLYATSNGEEHLEADMRCERNDDYDRHLESDAEWDDELSQQPF
jgi:hypothetical protein